MKYIKKFETLKSPDEWKLGDIVVSKELKYSDHTDWIVPGEKYEIVEFAHKGTTIKVKNINNGRIYSTYFSKYNFMTEEEWELTQQSKKYNL